jgi:hypothetical protein
VTSGDFILGEKGTACLGSENHPGMNFYPRIYPDIIPSITDITVTSWKISPLNYPSFEKMATRRMATKGHSCLRSFHFSGLFREQMDQVDVALRHNFMDSFNDKGRVSTMLTLGKMLQHLEKNEKCVKNV